MIHVCRICGKEVEAMAYKGTGACSQPHLEQLLATPERVRLVTAPAPDLTRPLATMDVSYLIDWHDDDGWTDWVAYGTAKSPEAAHAVVDEMLTHPHAPKHWRIVKVTMTRDTIEETP